VELETLHLYLPLKEVTVQHQYLKVFQTKAAAELAEAEELLVQTLELLAEIMVVTAELELEILLQDRP
jgi:hypothetical protein